MPFTTLSGLQIKVPTRLTKNWDAVMLADTFSKIASHQHTGSGDGNQMVTNSYSDNSVTGAKIRLDNAEYLRARNSANSADINILRVKPDDTIEFTGSVSSSGNKTINEPGAAIVVANGETLDQCNIVIAASLSVTVEAGGFFCGCHQATVLGDLCFEAGSVGSIC